MILTEQKPMKEILKLLNDEKNIFLIGCNGCAEVCDTGGKEACLKMKGELEKAGKKVLGCIDIDFLCNKMLDRIRIDRNMDIIKNADSILVLSCGIGVQAVGAVIEKPVCPANNSVFVGGFQGLWPSTERCEECGKCFLGLTSGICPITACTKGLLNGPCGGALKGMCEVDKERECGWHNIYERLKKLGKLKKLNMFVEARDYRKMMPDKKTRGSKYYDIESEEEVIVNE